MINFVIFNLDLEILKDCFFFPHTDGKFYKYLLGKKFIIISVAML